MFLEHLCYVLCVNVVIHENSSFAKAQVVVLSLESV
jgi:hypothetical protein